MLRMLFCAAGFATVTASLPVQAAECNTGWEVFSHLPYQQIAFPDTSVRYWRLRFALPEQDIALRVKGEFPFSRYTNFSIYKQETSDSSDSLPDYRIVPDEGSTNPFLNGADRNAVERKYTMWVLPATARVPTPNVIDYPPVPLVDDDQPEGQRLELWYRVYQPDAGRDDRGGVGLPKIEAFHYDPNVAPEDWQPVACPLRATSTPPLFDAARNLPPRRADDQVRFLAPKPAGLYANPDNQYLIARTNYRRNVDVAVIKFKAPTFVATRQGPAVFDADKDVRYWSLCVSGLTTVTSGCIADDEVPVDATGHVTIVIGPPSVEQTARARGFGYIGRGLILTPVFIYRNLVTREGFPGSVEAVRRWDPDAGEPADNFDAERFIGDYAPRGTHCDAARFQQDSCQ